MLLLPLLAASSRTSARNPLMPHSAAIIAMTIAAIPMTIVLRSQRGMTTLHIAV
jgi:hypothetical protein